MKRVFVAEDDLTSLKLLGAVLKKWGYDVVSASDGSTAWQMLQTPGMPSLIVLDWMMPGMDGLDICRRIRKRGTQPPEYVILLTSMDRKQDIVAGLESGANDYITKPFDNDELRARLQVGQRVLELQTELVAAKKAFEFQATHDALTGLLNRRAILERLEREMSRCRRQESELSIMLLDIDHFKDVNDNYGHAVGDEVLREFSQRLRTVLRDYDSIGRYGGEEFLIVLPDICAIRNEETFERIRYSIGSEAFRTTAGALSVTTSAGATCSDGKSTVDGLIHEADSALYRAKNAGRNRVVFAERHP